MKDKIARFMIGRYGVDALTRFLLYVAIGFMLLGLFFHNELVGGIAFFILVLCYLRMFSKNRNARANENATYWRLRNQFLHFFKMRKSHHIYKCPTCKQKIRIPRGKGKVEITCPKCKAIFMKRS